MTAATPLRPAPRSPLPPRPLALRVRLDGIAPALKSLPRWYVWRYDLVKREDGTAEYTKVPYRPNDKKARPNDERTWSSFAVVAAAYKRGGWDGIGIALGDGLIGVDLDDCRNGDGDLTTFARRILDGATTYHEVSPSGDGVKAFAFADVEGGKGTGAEVVDGQAIEIYKGCSTAEPRPAGFPEWPKRDSEWAQWEREHRSFARWFAVTGHGNGLDVTDDAAMVQRAVDELTRARSLKGERTRRTNTLRTATGAIKDAPNGGRHNALKNGAVALTATLKAQGLDAAAIESIITAMGETQGLPLDEAAAVAEWAAAAIPADAPLPPLAPPLVRPAPPPVPPRAEARPAPARPSLVHASRLGEAVEKITWLIPGVLGLNAISQLFAPGGSGKSLLALDQALCVAQQAPVIYIAAEAAGEQEERVAAWCTHHGLDVGQLYFWPRPLTLKSPESVDAFIEEALALHPALIVLDPLAACMEGLEESSTGDMTIAVAAINRIREATGAAINVVHHSGWDSAHERGSSALRYACRVVVKLSTDDTGLMTLTCEKANNGKPFEARYFRLVEAGPSVTPIPASKATTRNSALTVKHLAILEALSLRQHTGGASFTQILDTTEQGKSTLNKGLHRLLDRGLIALDGRTYGLTEAGRRELTLAAAQTEFTSSPAYATGELTVNWQVNCPAEPAPAERDLARQDAEFTEFTADRDFVHPVHDDPAPEQFTVNTASECDSSPQFTPSSPISSPSEFTSSPRVPPLRGTQSELIEPEPGEPAEDEEFLRLLAEEEGAADLLRGDE